MPGGAGARCQTEAMSNALVLGAGGMVGMAYHAGVVRALEEVGGFRPADADLVVGTSAGSMVGAMLRSGLSTEDLFLAATGAHDELVVEAHDERPWVAAFEGPADVARRVFGSLYVLQRSLLRLPVPHLPRSLRRLFPGGFFTVAETEETLSEFLPTSWPAEPLWVVAVDVRTGRRVVLGRRNPPRTDLHTAVLASCAIPAFFQPVRVGRRTLVDGGVHSTTNLDLATKIEPSVIVGVVPMGYDPAGSPRPVERLTRDFAHRRLEREVAQARRAGTRVLLIRPSEADLEAFGGLNMMRRDGNDRVTHVAYESAARQLSSARSRDVLAQLHEAATV